MFNFFNSLLHKWSSKPQGTVKSAFLFFLIMDLQQIKSALKAGKKVYWSNKAYEVIQSKFTQEYLVKCHLNNTYHGLTWRDGVTMNGDPKDFFMA